MAIDVPVFGAQPQGDITQIPAPAAPAPAATPQAPAPAPAAAPQAPAPAAAPQAPAPAAPAAPAGPASTAPVPQAPAAPGPAGPASAEPVTPAAPVAPPVANVPENAVPQHQYDQLRDNARQWQQQLRELQEQQAKQEQQAQQPQQPAADTDPEAQYNQKISELQKKAAEATFDGDAARAAEFNTQAMNLAAERIMERQKTLAEETREQAVNAVAVQQVADQLQSQYPQLDATSPQFNEQMTNTVAAVYQGFVASGKSPAQALREAATLTLQANGAMPVQQPQPVQQQPQPVVAQQPGNPQNNIATALATPPAPGAFGVPGAAVGQQAALPDASALTQDQWDALPAETRNAILTGQAQPS